MSARNEATRETLQLIKQAIYDLQVGPSEILTSPQKPDLLNVRFDSRKGTPQEVSVPVPSTYAAISSALKTAYNK